MHLLDLFDLFVRLEVNTAHAVVLRSAELNHLICFKSRLSDFELAFRTFLLFLPCLNNVVLLCLSELFVFSGILQVKLA